MKYPIQGHVLPQWVRVEPSNLRSRVVKTTLRAGVSSRKVGTGYLAFLNFPFPGIPGIFFFYFDKDFSSTDVYHSDVKNASLQVKIFFLLIKNYFGKFAKIFEDKMLVRWKFFP